MQSSTFRALTSSCSHPDRNRSHPTLQRINGATGKKEFLPLADTLSVRDAGLWDGIRLEQWSFASAGHYALEQTQLLAHVICVCVSGTCRTNFHMSGEKRVQGFTKGPGMIGIFPSGRPFSADMTWDESAALLTFLAIAITPQLLQRAGAGRGSQVVLRPSIAATDQFVLTAAVSFHEDFRRHSPLGPIYGETLGVALTTHLIRDHAEIPSERFDDPAELRASCARKIRDYIDAHIGDPISLSDLASLAGLEIHQIAKAFKGSFGVPPHRYLINARVRFAKDLLKSPTLRLVDVAYRTGFANQGHFTTTFKKWTGLCPSEYRKQVT